jgi:hypothetical protein
MGSRLPGAKAGAGLPIIGSLVEVIVRDSQPSWPGRPRLANSPWIVSASEIVAHLLPQLSQFPSLALHLPAAAFLSIVQSVSQKARSHSSGRTVFVFNWR